MQVYQTFNEEDDDQLTEYSFQVMDNSLIYDTNDDDLCDKTCHILTITCTAFLGLLMFVSIIIKIF